MVVDKAHYTKSEYAFLRDNSAIRLGPCSFYFHLPPQAEPQESDSDDESRGGGQEAAGGTLFDSSADEDEGGSAFQQAPPVVKPAGGNNKGSTYVDLVNAVRMRKTSGSDAGGAGACTQLAKCW